MYCNAKSIAINSRSVQEVKKYKMFPQPWQDTNVYGGVHDTY